MESAFAWFGKLFEFFGSLFPRLLIIKTTHKAIKYVHGKKLVLLEPGLHLYWPIVTEVEMCAVVRQVLNLNSQIIETKDKVPVTVGGLVVYEIDDIRAFLAENEDSYRTIDDISTAAIRDVIISSTYDEIRQQTNVQEELTNKVQELLDPYGIVVEYVRLTDFAKAKVLYLTGFSASTN